MLATLVELGAVMGVPVLGESTTAGMGVPVLDESTTAELLVWLTVGVVLPVWLTVA